MTFGHEQLDVYRAAVEYVGWAFRLCEPWKAHRNAKEQLLRASQSIPLNIAEGNGKPTEGERRRFFEIARGSTLECAAIQDVLEVCGALSPSENANAKKLLDRMVAMLTRLRQRGYSVREGPDVCGSDDVESDFDSNTDSDNDFKVGAVVGR
jgi:four helix bundle protein